LEGKVFIKKFVTEGFSDVIGFNNHITQARAWWDEEIVSLVSLLFGFREHLFIVRDTSFRFCLTSFWGHANPLEFFGHLLLTLRLLLLFCCKTVCFLFKP